MEPIVLKVYDSDVERVGEIVQQVGHLTIFQNKIKISSRKIEAIYYNAIYVPIGNGDSLTTPYVRDNITTYDNLLECISDFYKKRYYLKSKDMQHFTAIAKMQFKQLIEKITDPSEKTQGEPEEEEENTIFCVKCGKDPGGSFFHPSEGPHCVECYRKYLGCRKEENTTPATEEKESLLKDYKCSRCGKIETAFKTYFNDDKTEIFCHDCFYKLQEEKI